MDTTRKVDAGQPGVTRFLPDATVRVPEPENRDETVRLDGSGLFDTVQPAFQMLPPGTVFAGRYKVLRMPPLLGQKLQGGEADLFYAEHDGEHCLIKIYRNNSRPDRKILEKLQQLESDCLLKPLEYGSVGNRFYEVLPFAAGGNPQGKLPVRQLRVLAGAIADGLGVLHAADIVHRDIKPSNLLYLDREKSRPVLADYGISTLLEDPACSVRMTAAHRSDGYAAPELYGGAVDREADFYSTGITLLELATGIYPFAGCNPREVQFQTLAGKVDIPDSLDKNLGRLIRGLLIKEREERFGLDALRRFAAGKKVPDPVVSAQKKTGTPVFRLRFSYPLPVASAQEIFCLEDAALWLEQEPEEALNAVRSGVLTGWLRNNCSIDAGVKGIYKKTEDLIAGTERDQELLQLIRWVLTGRIVLFDGVDCTESRSKLIQQLRRCPAEIGTALLRYLN